MHKKVQNILKMFLFLGAVYFFVDGFIHFFDIKLLNVGNSWPASALAYARLLDKVTGVFILLTAATLFVIRRDPKKYKAIIYLSAVGTLLLGVSFIYLGLSTDYSIVFSLMPSLVVWLPFYGQYLLLEAGALICYSLLVYLWFRSRPDA
ncbi:MAG: hypothetical protein Q7R77_03560 [Candidatus Daviesbacteria bacterium]|nr:hypothetical protein [Candidatus Daviesbacteria bacterium]